MDLHFCPSIVFSVFLTSLSLAQSPFNTRPGAPLARQGDEIVVCGQLFHTGAPVVLWMDPGGYDAYRVEKHFSVPPASQPPSTPAAATSETTPEPTSSPTTSSTSPTSRPWGRN